MSPYRILNKAPDINLHSKKVSITIFFKRHLLFIGASPFYLTDLDTSQLWEGELCLS